MPSHPPNTPLLESEGVPRGRSPFAAPSGTEVLAAILDRDPLPLARFDPDVPAELQRIVTKCLKKERAFRYQVVQDLVLDLQALREELPAPARSGSSPSADVPATAAPAASGATGPVVRRRSARLRWALGLSTILLGALLGGAVWWWVRARAAQQASTPSSPVARSLMRLTFGSGLQTDVTWSPDGTRIAYAADSAGNFDVWVQPVAGGQAVQLTRSPAHDTQPAWSPDGRSIVFRSERDGGGLFTVPTTGGPERQLTSFGILPWWSRDGSEIFFRGGTIEGGATSLHVVSSDGGEQPLELLRGFLSGGNWTWIASHPDGRLSVLGLHRDSGLGLYTVSREGSAVTRSSIPRDLPVRPEAGIVVGTRLSRFQWNASGTALVVEGTVKEVQNIWRVRVDPESLTWLSAERLTTGTGMDVAAALSPSGARMAFTTQREAARLWVVPFDPVAGRLKGEGNAVTVEEGVESSDLSPDGRAVVYGVRQPGSDRADIWVTDVDTGTRGLVAQNARAPVWSPDGKAIAYILFRDNPPSARTPDRQSTDEWALGMRELGGPEHLLSRWSTKALLLPSAWTRTRARSRARTRRQSSQVWLPSRCGPVPLARPRPRRACCWPILNEVSGRAVTRRTDGGSCLLRCPTAPVHTT